MKESTNKKYLAEKLFLDTMSKFEKRFDVRFADIKTQIGDMKTYMKEGFDVVFDRFEKIDQRFDDIDRKIEDLGMTKVDKEEFLPLYKRVVRLEKKVV